MINETFLDLHLFSGKESILELYKEAPMFEKELSKRGKVYTAEKISVGFSEKVKNYGLVVLCLEQDLSQEDIFALKEFEKQKAKFLVIAKNKYNFHEILDYFEGKKEEGFKGVTFGMLKALFSKAKIFCLFHDTEDPRSIFPINSKFTYLPGRSGREGGKRSLRKCLSVILEKIFIKYFRCKSLYPGYIFVSE